MVVFKCYEFLFLGLIRHDCEMKMAARGLEVGPPVRASRRTDQATCGERVQHVGGEKIRDRQIGYCHIRPSS